MPMQMFPLDAKANFMAKAKITVAIFVLLAIASALIIGFKGFNFALDFTGGTVAQIGFAKPIEVGVVRQKLEAAGIEGAQVQSYGGSSEVSVRMHAQSSEDPAALQQVGDQVLAALDSPENKATLKSRDFVGPQIGKELADSGVVAILLVLVGILLYVAIRFEWRFALAAVACEGMDVLITLGLFCALGYEFDLSALAAILAVVGYSINDTIVVFDRIREMFRTSRRDNPHEIMNLAINQTLSRTVISSLTTLLTTLALFLVGGPSLKSFSAMLLIGIMAGTLSSIFFAAPVALMLGVSKKDMMRSVEVDPDLPARP